MPGYQTCSTITLHEASNKVGSRNVAVELVGVAAEEIEWLPNLLSTAAFYIIRDGWTAAPGVLFELLVEEYDPGTSLPHLLWVPPSPWAGLHGVETSDGGSVHWLLGVAVSDAEAEFIKSNGFDAFEELMDKAHLDYFDFSRRSLL